MAQTMIASAAQRPSITDGQIENVVDKFRAALRKHRSEFPRDIVQNVVELENTGMECLAPFRARVEAQSDLIIRHVLVNRARAPQEMLDATGRRQYKDQSVVDAMPRGKGEEVDFYFFKPRPEAYKNGVMSDEALEKELKFHGLVSDPYAQAAVNEADPAFADTHHNGTHWKGAPDGKWHFAAFDRWGGERDVFVLRGGDGWGGHWWFGGVRKYQNQSLES